MTFLFLLLYNYYCTKEVIKIIYFNNHDIILKEKEKINDLITIQQNFSKLLLGYIEKIMGNTNSIAFISSNKILVTLNHLKDALHCCNKNISILKYLLLLLNNESFDFDDLKEFNNVYLEQLSYVNKNTIFIENFLLSMLTFTELNFEFPIDIDNLNNTNVDTSLTKSVEISDEIKNRENTLVISETKGKVFLPYYIKDLENLWKKDTTKTINEIIEENYTIPLDQYKVPFISRFKEAFKLAHTKEKKSIKFAFDLGTELLFNYNLHPAIITACRNLDELDIYLDYLETNETEKFDCFNIIFEIPPILLKNKDKLF